MTHRAGPPPFILIALFLVACDGNQHLIGAGMFVAPLCYLGAVTLLTVLRLMWRTHAPNSRMRPSVLAIPLLILCLGTLKSLDWLHDVWLSRDETKLFLMLIAPAAALFALGALSVPVLVLWRIWFAISARTSFEGAAILATLSFYAPGFAVLFGMFAPTESFIKVVMLTCVFLNKVSIPLGILAIAEAIFRGSRSPKPLQDRLAKDL
jgi:hypothetical protein